MYDKMPTKHKIHILMKQNLNNSITKISLLPKADRVDLMGQQVERTGFNEVQTEVNLHV